MPFRTLGGNTRYRFSSKRSRSGSITARSIRSRQVPQFRRNVSVANRYRKQNPRQGPRAPRVTNNSNYTVSSNSGLFGKQKYGVLTATTATVLTNVVTNTTTTSNIYVPLGGFTTANGAGAAPGYTNLTLLGTCFRKAMIWKVDVTITANATVDAGRLYILAQRSNVNSAQSTFLDGISQNTAAELDGCVVMEVPIGVPSTYTYSYYPWKVLGIPMQAWYNNVCFSNNSGGAVLYYGGLAVNSDTTALDNICPVLGIASAAMSGSGTLAGTVEVLIQLKAHFKAWDPLLETGS